MLRGKKDLEEDGGREAEARPVDVKIKTSEAGESAVPANVKLLKEIQDERWENYEWIDAEVSAFLGTTILLDFFS
jgi:DNA-directed RNA polymerase